MKILIVCRYKEAFTTHITPFITEQGDSVNKMDGYIVDYFTIKGKGFLSYFTQVKELKKRIKEFKPDIIHAHYGLSGLTAVLQRMVPVVITFHNGEVDTFLGNLFSSIASLFAKHTIYVAQHIYDRTFLKPKSDYTIMPCGINIEDCNITEQEEARKQLGFEDGKKYILFGGSFNNIRKNYKVIKDALMLDGRSFVKTDIGDDYGDIVCMEMKGLSRNECVLRMCACDLFMLPSKSEGSPQALKEAIACNCPIVATDIADIKHLLGNLPGHYICSFEPEDVAKKIKLALDFKGRTNGRKRIIELGLTNEQVAKKIISIYNQVLEKLHE